MEKANNILLKILGMLLLTAAILKSWQLLSEPVASTDIWSNRNFLIFTVEFELALGIWLLSDIFKKLAWLAALVCFVMFSVITLYKGISGADSCGCFGSVKVNPWITLFAIDAPASLALIFFRPKEVTLSHIRKPFELLKPLPSRLYFVSIFILGIITLVVTLPVLALNEPAKVTQSYEVLEPNTWIGKPLPIIEYIDIGDKLKTGNWLVLFYHYDCHDCINAIEKLNNAKHQIQNENCNVVIIEIPPYGGQLKTPFVYGRLLNVKEWFITTPVMILLKDSKVKRTWQQELPDWSSLSMRYTREQTQNLCLLKGGDDCMIQFYIL